MENNYISGVVSNIKIDRFYFTLILPAILFCSCSFSGTANAPAHRVRFFTGSTNNKLEVLDWGGNGKALIFLAGLGSSAHVFDEFAPKFRGDFHVYAITRRGFGASSPAKRYDLKTLAADIIAVMDSLRLEKVILAGHSIAGEEITKFAVLYPSRVDKIIYLDAALDRTSPLLKEMNSNSPAYPQITAADSASLVNLKKYYASISGVSPGDEELMQIVIFSKEGRYLKDVTPDSVYTAIMAAVERPDYMHIKCPALAIYSLHDSVQQDCHFYASLDTANQKKADKQFILSMKFRSEERNRFEKEVQGGIVKVIKGANHYIFISHPLETERLMRDFLK